MSRSTTRTPPQDPPAELSSLHDHHNKEWRDPAQVASQWSGGGEVDPRLLEYAVRGEWWEALGECGIMLVVTREYEHLIMAMRPTAGGGRVSYMALPHPSGLAVDRTRMVVHIASTRNPNQVFDLIPIAGLRQRLDIPAMETEKELVPIRSRFYPGCLYIHDLSMIGGDLHANAVGENAVVRLDEDGRAQRVWWPKCIETEDGPIFSRNQLQLNSIAAGNDLARSYFSASTSRLTRWRPGHLKFPVDRCGVIFSGATREPVVHGLTRPHSARLHRGEVWVDNSGYGEVGVARDGRFHTVAKLPGWTRGLCFHGDVLFVGTSRVIPRFRKYAPGLDVSSSICAVHAIDSRTGRIRGSLVWKWGNQIFAIDWLPQDVTNGFPWVVSRQRPTRTKKLFYAFTTEFNR
jgi:uncharacterized protein (TIGR03032 family)